MTLTFRHIRIIILTLILIYVASDHYFGVKRTTAWTQPLNVFIYPINGDDSSSSSAMIDSLTVDDFANVNHFLVSQAKYFGLTIDQAVNVHVTHELKKKTPALPQSQSIISAIGWSLRMRWWAWQVSLFHNDGVNGLKPDIRLYVEYYANASERSYHSVGLQKGRIGIVKNYADRRFLGRNNMILTHELLHTLGAMDKYDMQTLQPVYPIGYAKPYEYPKYPQHLAEIMGGRIPVNQDVAYVPESLALCVIGETTANEIGWIKALTKQQGLRQQSFVDQ